MMPERLWWRDHSRDKKTMAKTKEHIKWNNIRKKYEIFFFSHVMHVYTELTRTFCDNTVKRREHLNFCLFFFSLDVNVPLHEAKCNFGL